MKKEKTLLEIIDTTGEPNIIEENFIKQSIMNNSNYLHGNKELDSYYRNQVAAYIYPNLITLHKDTRFEVVAQTSIKAANALIQALKDDEKGRERENEPAVQDEGKPFTVEEAIESVADSVFGHNQESFEKKRLKDSLQLFVDTLNRQSNGTRKP